MRVSSIVLAITLLLISVYPCCIDGDCGALATEQSAEPEHEDDCGACSPFFSCEGCATATIAYTVHVHTFSPPLIAKVFPPVFQDDLAEIARKCWQPPKLG